MTEGRGEGATVWSDAYRRLEELEEALRSGRSRGEEAVRAVLEERARRLARPPQPPPPTDLLEVVVFLIAREKYAISARAVESVFRLTGRTALPGAPPPIAGVTAHRGELLTLIDIRADLGLQPRALDDLGRVVILRSERQRAGMLVDQVEGTRDVRLTQLARKAVPSADSSLFLGVTMDLVAVLDAEAILRFFDGGDDS